MKKRIYQLAQCVFIITSFSSCLKVVDKEKEALEKEIREKEKVVIAEKAIPETEFYFKGENVLKEDLKVEADKVFMDSDAHIYTGPYQLQIFAKKLVVKTGAKIQSFPEGDTAGFNQKGLDGGLVEIKSELATGELYVYMNGQNSGQGKWGYIQAPFGMLTRGACYPSWGPKGGNGGEAHLSFSESKDFIIHPRPSSGAGGRLGETSYQGNIPNFKNAEHMVFYKSLKDPTCSVAPVPSEAGFLGKICIRRSDADPAGCIQ